MKKEEIFDDFIRDYTSEKKLTPKEKQMFENTIALLKNYEIKCTEKKGIISWLRFKTFKFLMFLLNIVLKKETKKKNIWKKERVRKKVLSISKITNDIRIREHKKMFDEDKKELQSEKYKNFLKDKTQEIYYHGGHKPHGIKEVSYRKNSIS